ncbi:MAG: LysR substrate-binding domain-containing protein [Desulfovibrio sp.]
MFDIKPTQKSTDLPHVELSIDVLRTFIAAARTGSFTYAAQQVNRTQAAVSMQMRKLEEELGREFFERTPRGVKLTPAGVVLLDSAKQLVALHDETVAGLLTPQYSGVVRFGVPSVYATSFLSNLLSHFAAEYPNIIVEVLCATSSELLDMYTKGKVDVCILTDSGNGSHGEHLYDVPLVWMGSKGGNAHRKKPLPLAVFGEDCIYRREAVARLNKRDIEWSVAYMSPSDTAVIAAVQADLAVASVGKSMVQDGCEVLGEEHGLPSLPSVPITLLYDRETDSETIHCLAKHVHKVFADR